MWHLSVNLPNSWIYYKNDRYTGEIAEFLQIVKINDTDDNFLVKHSIIHSNGILQLKEKKYITYNKIFTEYNINLIDIQDKIIKNLNDLYE